MIDVLNEASRLRRETLHAMEIPTAQLTALMANINRDTKKQKKPYAMEDFCFFLDRDAMKPEALAAAAYQRLLADKLLPPWALFCFADFKGAEPSRRDASEVAIIGDGWILLAPAELDSGFSGLLLAEQRAAGTIATGSFAGQSVDVELPHFQEFVMAKAGVTLEEVTQQPVVPAA